VCERHVAVAFWCEDAGHAIFRVLTIAEEYEKIAQRAAARMSDIEAEKLQPK
jgi:hypothetical protein